MKRIILPMLLSLPAYLAVLLISCSAPRYLLSKDAQAIKEQVGRVLESPRFTLMPGTPYQTGVFVFEGTEAGPAVIILGGTHGDEPAGYETAWRIVQKLNQSPLKKGKVIIIPEANKQAVQNFARRVEVPAGVDEERGNLNRCYPGKEHGLPMEQLAFGIQQLAIENNADVFIDLHEAREFHLNIEEGAEQKGLGQTIIYTPNEPSTWLVIQMIDKMNEKIPDALEKFTALERPIKNSGAWWAGQELGIAAFTFETSRKLPLEKRIRYHLTLVDIVLNDRQME